MKPQELRIGNLVADFDCEPFYFEVDQITLTKNGDYRIHYRNNSISAIVDESHKIPLTEEWLLKFGFKIDKPFGEIGFNTDANKFPLFLTKNINGFWVMRNIQRGGLVSIHYVHSLQNLYFALTGEELQL